MLRIGIPKEIFAGETRVALVPRMVAQLKTEDREIFVETDAGRNASFLNHEYELAGAKIISDTETLFRESDVLFKINPPQMNEIRSKHEIDLMKLGSMYIGLLAPLQNRDSIQKMLEKKITSFALEYIPRIARAQSMDVLTSMASIAGYRAVLIAAHYLGKFFPLMMTAAGTIPPARVLVLGAGVAGLQAIATARRLGAKVEAFDVRPAVKEQVESLGAQFIEMELPKDAETQQGYAKEMSEEFLKKEFEIIENRLTKNDVVITTAQVFGKKAPTLINEDMVKRMKEGSVIIDLAAEQGGNCTLTEPGKVMVKHGIIIYGPLNLPATLPIDASYMYSKNITNFFKELYKSKDWSINFDDEIIAKTCITHDGVIMSEIVKNAFQ